MLDLEEDKKKAFNWAVFSDKILNPHTKEYQIIKKESAQGKRNEKEENSHTQFLQKPSKSMINLMEPRKTMKGQSVT